MYRNSTILFLDSLQCTENLCNPEANNDDNNDYDIYDDNDWNNNDDNDWNDNDDNDDDQSDDDDGNDDDVKNDDDVNPPLVLTNNTSGPNLNEQSMQIISILRGVAIK